MATLHRHKTGIYLGIPYDWRRPTLARAKSRWWNPRDRRLFTPKTFGWGFDINLARLLRRKPKPLAQRGRKYVNRLR
jgi:uncharacterized protein DUF5808